MLENLDIKMIYAISAALLIIIGYTYYFRNIFKKNTHPHKYTWLVWVITQGTASAAIFYGGGKFGSLSLMISSIFIATIFLLSFKYGTRDIKRSDKIVLAVALSAVLVWWELDNPLLAVLMVTGIDSFGYLPTIRKSIKNPWDETLFFWAITATAEFLALMAITEYNMLTMTYLTVVCILDFSVVAICLSRRKMIAKVVARN